MTMQVHKMRSSVGDCAHELLDVVPLVFREIRGELRKYGAKEMSVPQFRTLGFIYRNQGASLSEVGDHIGLTLPTVSTLVDGLVDRGLITRREDSDDRRRMTLTLTQAGRTRLESAREATLANLEQRIRQLPTSDRVTIIAAMHVLRALFARVDTHAKN